MTAEINLRQYVIFIKPKIFDTAVILSVLQSSIVMGFLRYKVYINPV